MKKCLALVLALLMVVGLFAGCSNSSKNDAAADGDNAASVNDTVKDDGSEDSENDAKAEDSYKIAIVPMSLNDPYQVMMANAAKLHCDELGYEGVIQTPGSGSMGDMQGQVELVENIIANGTYDGIVLAPISKDGAVICIKDCQDAGIPIVLMDSNADQDALVNDGYEEVPFIGTGNYNAAVETGKWIRENYDEGVKLAKINGPDGHDNGDARKNGLDDGLDGWANVVAEQSTQWAVDESYTATQNIISANPDVELIWCACDALGVGAVRALEEAGLADKVDVMAYDGTNDGLKLVLDGSEVANTAQFPDTMGIGAVDILLDVINGKDVELVTDSGFEIIVADTAQALMDRLAAYL